MMIWSTKNEDINRAAAAAADKSFFGTADGLYGYGEWSVRSFPVKYIHRDGSIYSFDKSWRTGSGTATRRCIGFRPEGPCIVTVVYASKPGRPLYICQGDSILACGTASVENGIAPSITADITDPSAGDIIIRGGASDKDVFAVIAEYYDPDEIFYINVSGKIEYKCKKNITDAGLVFRDIKDGREYKVPFGKNYSLSIRRSREYEVRVFGAEGVCPALGSKYLKTGTDDMTVDISVCDIAPAEVTGDVLIHRLYQSGRELDINKIRLDFIGVAGVYTAEIKDSRLRVTLAPGKYQVQAWNIPGYELSELSESYELKAGDMNPFKNILIKEKVIRSAYTPVLEVGDGSEFASVNDAVAHVRQMERPKGEAGRVTIVVHSGTYMEQVFIDTLYVTLKGDDTARPIVCFYYGIAYLYYSAKDGYYDEDCAAAKTRKGAVTEWGPVCRITAESVRVENIIFKNTFNCELTKAEFEDGCEPAKGCEYPDTSGKQPRDTAGYDVMSKASTERAAAIAITGDHCEICNCDFISSQDTFYTNCTAQVRNCYIEGGADYVFGGGDVIFENCILAWHGFSDGEYDGYISANKNPDKNSPGHLFRNCTVTTSRYYPKNKFAPGRWGRNWGGAFTRVMFENTTVRCAAVPGPWVRMNGDLENSDILVIKVTDREGNHIDTAPFNPNGVSEYYRK